MNLRGRVISPAGLGTRDRIAALLLAVASALFLFAFRSQYQTPDSLEYANSVRFGTDLFHPHHIIFSSVVRLIYFVIGAISGHYDAILAGQVHNIAWTALSVTFIFVILRMLKLPRTASLAIATILLVTSSFWNYSTLVEVYMGAVGCLALLVYFMLRWDVARPALWQLLILAILLAFSILYHQTDVLFCIPFAYLFLHSTRMGGFRSLSFVILIAGALTLTVYISAFLTIDGEHTVSAFIQYCFSYVTAESPNWGTFRHYSPTGVGQLLKNQLRDFVPVAGGTSPSIAISVLLFGLALAAAVGHNLRTVIQKGRNASIRMFLIIWLAVNYLFFLWWLPYDKEFFITTMIPIALLSALCYQDSLLSRSESHRVRYTIRVAAVVIFVGMFTFNLTSTVLPRHRSRGDDYLKAERIAAISSPECRIYCDLGERNNLLYYFERRNVDLAFVPLSYFYRNLPLPERFTIDSIDCVFIPLKWVEPKFEFGHESGLSAPELWFESVKWLFGISTTSPISTVLHRDFHALVDSAGIAYLAVGPTFTESDSMQLFFEAMDSSIENATKSRYLQFEEWSKENGSRIRIR